MLNKIKLLALCLTLFSSSYSQNTNNNWTKKIVKRKYHKTVKKAEKQLNKSFRELIKTENFNEETPLGWWKQEFIATMDPKLGRPTPEVLLPVLSSLNSKNSVIKRGTPGTKNFPWKMRGPNNVGGRTRALAWDPNDSKGKKVWAGGVTGGLWYNNDITSSTSSWESVSDVWSNLTVTCIAFDPNDSKVIYVGTGEGFGSTSSTSRGYGIFKSTDGGTSWSHLSSSSNYLYINDIIIRNESGTSVLYAAVDINFFAGIWHGNGSNVGLFRSTNGGSSFSQVLPKISGQNYPGAPSDLEIDANNTLWVGTRKNAGNSSSDRGGGRIYYSTNGTSFTEAYKNSGALEGRVSLACAPSSADTLYALIESGGKLHAVVRSFNGGSNWSTVTEPSDADNGIASTDFTRGQAWYDLEVSVNPTNAADVTIGGINLFRSTNAGSNWKQISKWSENANMNQLSCSYVHADQHAINYHSDGNQIIIGNDGGVFYCSDITNSPESRSTAFIERNNGYMVTQFYCGDMSMTKNSNVMIAGAQDNGTKYFYTSGVNDETTLSGGDGGYCMISETSEITHVVSYTYNNFFATTNNWSSFVQVLSDASSGKFINPADLDYVNNILYSGKTTGELYRNSITQNSSNASTITFGGSSSGKASAIYSYKRKSNNKNRLIVGSDVGKLFYSDNAETSSPTFTDISSGINAGNISSIYNHNGGDDTLFVTLSNYGINNIYRSLNAGSTWTAIDGDLANMPVHSIVSNPYDNKSALIATELGVYICEDIYASSPKWVACNEGMGAVKTMALRFRKSDGVVMATTHGRGVFTSDAWIKQDPNSTISFSDTLICQGTTISAMSNSNNVDSLRWLVSPNTGVTISNPTSANTNIKFNNAGNFIVKLTSYGSGISSDQTQNITVSSKVNLTLTGYSVLVDGTNKKLVSESSTLKITANGSNIDSLTWYKSTLSNPNGSAISNSNVNPLTINPKQEDGSDYWVEVFSNSKCANPANLKASTKIGTPIAGFNYNDSVLCANEHLVLSSPNKNADKWVWIIKDANNQIIMSDSTSDTAQFTIQNIGNYTITHRSHMGLLYSESSIPLRIKTSNPMDLSNFSYSVNGVKNADACWDDTVTLALYPKYHDSIQWYYSTALQPIPIELSGETSNTLSILPKLIDGRIYFAKTFSNQTCIIPRESKSATYVIDGNNSTLTIDRIGDSLFVVNKPQGHPILWYLNGTQIGQADHLIAVNNGNYTAKSYVKQCLSPESNTLVLTTVNKNDISRHGEIFPNPSNGIFYWKSNFNGFIRIQSSTGKIISELKVSMGNNKTAIDLSSYADGIYFLSGYAESGEELFSSQKLLKNK